MNELKIQQVLNSHFKLDNIRELYIRKHDMNFEELFEVVSVLGEGTFGVVLEVYNKKNDEISALKVWIEYLLPFEFR